MQWNVLLITWWHQKLCHLCQKTAPSFVESLKENFKHEHHKFTGCSKLHWGKKLTMRCSRRMQLHELTSDNSRKCKNCMDNVQKLYLSANDLDKVIASTASNLVKTELSLLQYLDRVKSNGPSQKKLKACQ